MSWLSKHLKLLKDFGKLPFKNRLDENASNLLSRAGVREGQSILDFGCGSGTYTIPAAKLVGEGGTVFALDVNEDAFDELEKTAEKEGLENISRIDSEGGERIPLEDNELDWTFLIDVLHEIEKKSKLFDEIYRALKPSGSVCVYPMHIEKEKVENMAEESNFEVKEELFDGRILLFSPTNPN